MITTFLKNKIPLSGSILAVGALVWAALGLQGCGGGDGFFKNLTMCDANQEASLDSQSRIGGSSTVVEMPDPASNWIFYNVANDLRATRVGVTESAKYSLPVEGFIHDIDVVEYPANSGVRYALLSMGDKGIAVINVTDPTNMFAVLSVHVLYLIHI